MARKEIAVKKYVVTLSNQEREHLTALIHSGHHPAQKLLKARILLKADASDGGEGWSDSQIAAALETSVDTVARTRQRLVEEGFEAALIRKHSPNSARRRIFDGAASAAHDRVGAQPFACQQDDLGPPDVLPRAVTVRYHRFKTGTVGGRHIDEDPLAHAPD